MNCEKIQARLTALLDGELSERQAAEMQAHLAACPACARVREELAAAARLADTWEEAGGEVWEAVRQEIERVDAAALLEEMRGLSVEINALRTEMAELRRQLAARPSEPAQRSSGLLLPYVSASAPRSLIV